MAFDAEPQGGGGGGGAHRLLMILHRADCSLLGVMPARNKLVMVLGPNAITPEGRPDHIVTMWSDGHMEKSVLPWPEGFAPEVGQVVCFDLVEDGNGPQN